MGAETKAPFNVRFQTLAPRVRNPRRYGWKYENHPAATLEEATKLLAGLNAHGNEGGRIMELRGRRYQAI